MLKKSVRFGPFVLEQQEYRLTRNGRSLPLTPKEFELLSLLVGQAGRLVTKEEIFAKLWPDLKEVDESNVTQTIYKLRGHLKDNRGTEYIETVQKKGYRFVAPVDIQAGTATGVSPPATTRIWSSQKIALLAIVGLAAVGAIAFLIVRASPSDKGEDHYVRGLLLERDGKDAQARAEYDTAMKGLHSDEARVRAAWLAYQDFDNEAALQYLSPLLTSRTADQRLLMTAQAVDQAAKGYTEDSIVTLKQLTASNSDSVDGWYFLADISLDAGDFDDSEKALSRCLALSPVDPLCTYDRLLLWERTNRFEDSISGYKEAVSAGIKYPWIEEAAGYAELGMGNLKGAREHFDHLAALKYQDPHGYAFQASRDGLAAIALYTGKIGAARERIKSALQTSRSNYERASYELMLSQLDALVGRAFDAREEAGFAVADSSSDDIAVGAAEALGMTGDFARAKELLKKREGEGAALGRRYAAANEFVRALEALKSHHGEEATDLLYNSSDLGTLALHYLETAEIERRNWIAASEVSRQILSRRGEILHDGLPIVLPISEYRLGISENHLGKAASGSARTTRIEELWHDADPDAWSLLKAKH